MELDDYARRLNRLSTDGDNIRVFNLMFRHKTNDLSILENMKLVGKYNLKQFDFEDKEEKVSMNDFIDQFAGDYGHSITDKLILSKNSEGILLSYLDLNLRMQEGFYQYVGSKYQFNNKGLPSASVDVPFIIHNSVGVRYITLADGAEIVEIPSENKEISLILKFNKKVVDEYCPLCDDVLNLSEFEELMSNGRKELKLIFPQF